MNLHDDILTFDGTILPEVLLWGKEELGSDWYMAPHVFPRHALIIMTRGRALFHIEKQPIKVKDGDVLLVRKGQLLASEDVPHEPFECSYVHFAPMRGERMFKHGEVRRAVQRSRRAKAAPAEQGIFMTPGSRMQRVYLPALVALEDLQPDVVRIIEVALQECRRPVLSSALRASLCLAEILVCVTRKTIHSVCARDGVRETDAISSLVQDAVFTIRSEYSRHMNVRSLASALHVTPQHLIRKFRQDLGMSPLRYIHSVRMGRAREMLRLSRLSIKEISAASGFRSQHHFARLFARENGCTPSAYREVGREI